MKYLQSFILEQNANDIVLGHICSAIKNLYEAYNGLSIQLRDVREDYCCDASNILDLLRHDFKKGSEIEIEVSGNFDETILKNCASETKRKFEESF